MDELVKQGLNDTRKNVGRRGMRHPLTNFCPVRKDGDKRFSFACGIGSRGDENEVTKETDAVTLNPTMLGR